MAGIQIDGVNNKIDFDDDADTSISSATDDTLVVEVGGSTLATATATSLTINDGVTITTADNTEQLTLISTDADAASAPHLLLKRDSASPADNDVIGKITFAGENDAGEEVNYCRFRVHLTDVSDGTEDGNFRLFTLNGGVENSRIDIDATETAFNEDSSDIDFRVESNGNANMLFVNGGNNMVGVGVDPGHHFDVQASIAGDLVTRFNNSNAAPFVMLLQMSGASPDNNTNYFLACSDATTTRLVIRSDGDIYNHDNTYGAISDERIKQDIRDSSSQWDDIKAVKVRNYKKKDDVRQYGDKAWEQIGVVAQELESAGMDKLVKESDPTPADIASDASFGTLYEDGDTIPDGKAIGDVKEVKATVKAVSYSVLYMKAIKALQEAMAKIETLETKVKALEDA